MGIFKFSSQETTLDLVFSDSIILSDSLSLFSSISLSFIDSLQLNDSLGVLKTCNLIFNDSIILNDSIYCGDYVVSWRCRTKNINRGYGGEEYGSGAGYGGGDASDITEYYVEVTNNVNGNIVYTKYITINDDENPDYNFVYPKNINIANNGSFANNLTFRIYQVNSVGNFSLVNSISTA